MKKIKIIRILVAVGIIMIFFWLYWRVIPTLGMFHLLLNDPPAHIGPSLLYIVEGKTASKWALEWVKLGWPLVWQEWPFVTIGVLFGWASGYPFGEFTRRKFVVKESMPEKLRQKISQEESEMRTIALFKHWKAECRRLDAEGLYAAAQKEKMKTAADQREISILRMKVEEELKNAEQFQYEAEQFRHDLDSAKEELTNAKEELVKAEAQNRKLKKKLRAKLGKLIDES